MLLLRQLCAFSFVHTRSYNISKEENQYPTWGMYVRTACDSWHYQVANLQLRHSSNIYSIIDLLSASRTFPSYLYNTRRFAKRLVLYKYYDVKNNCILLMYNIDVYSRRPFQNGICIFEHKTYTRYENSVELFLLAESLLKMS